MNWIGIVQKPQIDYDNAKRTLLGRFKGVQRKDGGSSKLMEDRATSEARKKIISDVGQPSQKTAGPFEALRRGAECPVYQAVFYTQLFENKKKINKNTLGGFFRECRSRLMGWLYAPLAGAPRHPRNTFSARKDPWGADSTTGFAKSHQRPVERF